MRRGQLLRRMHHGQLQRPPPVRAAQSVDRCLRKRVARRLVGHRKKDILRNYTNDLLLQEVWVLEQMFPELMEL